MSADVPGFVAVNVLFLLAGLGVTGAAGWWRGPRAAAGSLGISYLAGVAAYGVVAQALLVAGASLSRAQVVLVCLVLALGAVRGLRGAGGPVWAPRLSWPVVVTAVLLVVLAVDMWWQPLWAYDSWTFWTPRAHALSALNGLDGRWFRSYDLGTLDYPLLLPAVEAAGFRFTGYEAGLLDIQSLLFVATALLAFAEVVVPRGPRWARVLPFLVVVSPSLADQIASAEADLPLAALFACAAVCGYLWHRERLAGSLALFAVFAGGAAATKIEGLPFVLSLLVALGVAEARRSRRDALVLAAVGLGSLLVALGPWRYWMSAHGISSESSFGRITDVHALADHAGRVPYSTGYLLAKTFDPRAWVLLAPLLVVLILLAARGARREAAVVAAIGILCFASLVLAYWTTPFELHFHLATTARRVITGPLFAWVFLVPLLFAARPPGDPATLNRP